MKKKKISLVALTIATAVTLTACTGSKISSKNKSVVNEVVENSVIEEVKNNSYTSFKPVFMLLLDEYNHSTKSTEEILKSESKSTSLYSSALYMKLREFGLDDETILKELHNVVTFGLVHPTEDGWKNDLLVKNLNQSVNYEKDAIIYYYPLAAYVHLFDCKLEHETIDNRIQCDLIQEDLMSMNDNILFANYVVEDVLSMDDSDPVKVALQKILSSNEDTETCIYELENIYELGMIPRCATEEEWNSVKHLRGTISEMENPFEVYYDLAFYVHVLRCEEEHYTNEFGQMECKTLRKELESGISK